MRSDLIAKCRQWFLAEIAAGAMPDMAAVFAGILDIRTVIHWAKTDPEFDAEWGRAAEAGKRREQLAERSKCPDAIVGWLRARGGKAGITLQKLGAELGFSAPRVHRTIQHLAATGIVRADFRTRGTVLELICPPAASPLVAAAAATDVPVASVIEWLRRRGCGRGTVAVKDMGRTRHRSPPFPFIPLSKAIERTRQLWDRKRLQWSDIRAGRQDTFESLLSVEELATVWRYGVKSSGLTQTAAALIQFGLISPRGGFNSRRFQFTSTWFGIVKGYPTSLALIKDSPRQLRAYRLTRKAALMPKMHRELFSRFGGARNVGDSAIQHYLVVDRELAHKAAFSAYSAGNLIKEYRATMEAAELNEIGPRLLPHSVFDSDNDIQFFDFVASDNARPPEEPNLMDAGASPDLDDSDEKGPPREITRSAPSKIKRENIERVWDQGVLSPTAEYRLLVSGEIGQKEIEVLIRRLQISKQTLASKNK